MMNIALPLCYQPLTIWMLVRIDIYNFSHLKLTHKHSGTSWTTWCV